TVWVAKRARDPVRHRLVAHLDVQLAHRFLKENSLHGLALRVEQSPSGFILLRPAPVKQPETQIGLALHLLEFLGADGPAIDGAVLARSAAEDTVSAAAPTGARIEENDERDNRGAGDQRQKPLLMPPNVCEHNLKFSRAPYPPRRG